ncbi:hypothetical protein PVAG01_05858 [Phlyctema vagabunda]|uniref:Uncharacterized protein n=1 Tax=Phlyctema vagabunda TaxID=108571 RepID=A0ABR4PF14_9HELO
MSVPLQHYITRGMSAISLSRQYVAATKSVTSCSFALYLMETATDRWCASLWLRALHSVAGAISRAKSLQYTEKTTIPIPKIHAYNLSDNTQPRSSFLILQYIEGRKLTDANLKSSPTSIAQAYTPPLLIFISNFDGLSFL